MHRHYTFMAQLASLTTTQGDQPEPCDPDTLRNHCLVVREATLKLPQPTNQPTSPNGQKANTETMSINISKTHRTALFVRVSENDSDERKNRVSGLVKSLNREPNVSEGGTIKTDVYTVAGDNVTKGYDPNAKPTPTEPPANLVAAAKAAGYKLEPTAVVTDVAEISDDELRKVAAEYGYVICLIG